MNELIIYVLIGFCAQLIDGAFGMAYGIMTTSLLLFIFPESITPAIASAVMHLSEFFNTGYATYIYQKKRLINKNMYKKMFFPAIGGAVSGAITISLFSKHFVSYIKPFIAIYLLILAVVIAFRAFQWFENRKRWMSIPVLSAFGAFMDSIGGGGWGALVTSALIASGRDIRSTIGTAHAIKFVVVIFSSFTFLTLLGVNYLWLVLWISIGSILAVPLSIYINNKIPKKWGLIFIAIILFFISLKIFINSITFYFS